MVFLLVSTKYKYSNTSYRVVPGTVIRWEGRVSTAPACMGMGVSLYFLSTVVQYISIGKVPYLRTY